MTIPSEEADACRVIPSGAAEQPNAGLEQACALEAFPNVLTKVIRLWGTRDLDKLIHDLILDSRDGSRQGFPLEVAAELMFLEQCNKYVRALDVAKNMNIGFKAALHMVDSGDQAHLTGGLWSDPTVAQDATVHRRKSATGTRPPPPAPAEALREHRQTSGPGMWPLFWVGALIAALLLIKLLFPNLFA